MGQHSSTRPFPQEQESERRRTPSPGGQREPWHQARSPTPIRPKVVLKPAGASRSRSPSLPGQVAARKVNFAGGAPAEIRYDSTRPVDESSANAEQGKGAPKGAMKKRKRDWAGTRQRRKEKD